nr:malonyl-coenzyme A:anthocyanin 3-O-glucoside-6''-O-malonyltransferase-like [Tanacetum cinerariifolium]
MASHAILTILEQSQVSPPPATIVDKTLPLIYFDFFWLRAAPVHNLFFYELPLTKTEFLESIVPSLKDSLSITLQHFFPFVGKLFIYPDPKKPEIRYVEGDSLAVTFAESDQDFDDLSGNHPRDCDKFYPLIPLLGQPEKTSNYTKLPIFAVQVTFFPNRGFSIGMTNHHTLGDASTRFCFLKAWISITRSGTDESFLANGTLPIYDRVEENPKAAESFLKFAKYETLKEDYEHQILSGPTDKVRATFVLTRNVLNQLKKSVSTELPTLAYVSSFTVACKLFIYPGPKKPEIRYVEGDSLAVTFAESDQDFDDLSGNHPRDCDKFYPLIPLLGQPEKTSNYTKLPIFAVQVTFFPNRGFSIGMTNHHTLGDASTRFCFLKAWISITRSGTDESFLANGTLPIYDRVEENPKAAESFLKARLNLPVPANYFGNCLGGCFALEKTTMLTGKEGFINAAKLLGESLHKTLTNKKGMLDLEFDSDLFADGVPSTMIGVAGTPKLKFYDIDFGWGKPKKVETVSIDYNGSISMNACKESNDDLEIGVCLPAAEMKTFIHTFQGKVYMARTKELFTWTPIFLDHKESKYISDDESLHGAKNKSVGSQHGEDDLVDDSDVEGVSKTFFGDKHPSPNNSVCNSSEKVVEQQSEDPFCIYDVLNKKPKGVAQDSDSSLSHPSGFTPEVTRQENDHRGVDLNIETYKVNSHLVHTKVMNNSQKVHEKVTSSGESAFNYSHNAHNGGSILEVLDDMIRVEQSMGYTMEGCMKDIEHIIGTQGVDVVPK